ncbi:MAG: Asp23/Gls24 family envelope stress response protein [Chloroflexi bacterium]|nr:Asp23/Gls24 family envelope stress response protein [Chloroflexota bacterium]
MPDEPIPGHALVTDRAVMDIVRGATLGSYGVAGFAGSPIERVRAFLGGRTPGLGVVMTEHKLNLRLHLRIISGLPVAEVARQVDSAVRYAIQRALGREIDRLSIRIRGLETPAGTEPPPRPSSTGPGSSDLADSGTDVA